ncbi:MAG: LysR family transcriptional regulator, partial [Pseudomonadota bacterium]
MDINYDFSDLQAFLAVKETGSFHLASKRLNMSQSAITRRVQKLETALGSALFERTTRMVRPTLAAKRLQPRAEAILDDARETTRAMRDESVTFVHQRSLVVTVATIPTVVARLIPPALHTFRAAGHRSRLRILDLAANEVSEAVSQGEADFGICSIPTLEANTEFETLFEDRMVLALPTDHPL